MEVRNVQFQVSIIDSWGFAERLCALNKTMVMVTHDIDEALQLGDRIAVLKEGRLLQTGTPADLLNDPGHDYVAQLLRHRSHGEHA